MQEQSNPALFQALVEALPLDFLQGLAAALTNAHSEAWASVDSPLFDEPEAAYLAPHMRRALFEKQFREVAKRSGLAASVKWTRGETAQYSVIRAGQFMFTASYISEPGGATRTAAFRSDFSSLNELLEQGQLFETGEVAVPADNKTEANTIYCMLGYGGGRKDAPLFMQFVFPSPNVGGSVERYNFEEVLAAVQSKQLPQEPNPIDNAHPKLKKQRRTGSDEDNHER